MLYQARMNEVTKSQKKLWTGIVILALLSPLGIILPRILDADDAWGEWGADTVEKLLGYVPEGLRKYAEFWKAPVSDYTFGGAESSMTVQVLSYIASGMLGILIIALVIYLISKLVIQNDR